MALWHYPGTKQAYHHNRDSRYIEWAKSSTHCFPLSGNSRFIIPSNST
jgi:hypothetical protein